MLVNLVLKTNYYNISLYE